MNYDRDQLDLFRDFAPESADEGRHLHRRADPDTSAEAAEDIVSNLAQLHQWTVACVQAAPGLTQRELGAKFCPTDPRRIGRRLNECEKAGLVRRGPARTCTVSGRQAETWFPA